ncbi:hypothetical protein BH11MYX1_BH11MYX1_25440 [soil metagenome]
MDGCLAVPEVSNRRGAADDTSVNAHLEHAARLEYEGMGKIVAPRASQWPSRLSASL